MSIRSSLWVHPKGNAKPLEAAEEVHWVPLLWLALIDHDGLDDSGDPFLSVELSSSLERLSRAIPFLAKLFPDFPLLEETAQDFLGLLERTKAKSLEIDLADHFAIDPAYPQRLQVALTAIASQNPKATFQKLKTTRDVLCSVSTDPRGEDAEFERGQLVGYVFLEDYTQQKNDAPQPSKRTSGKRTSAKKKAAKKTAKTTTRKKAAQRKKK